jgi:hypothetical protein
VFKLRQRNFGNFWVAPRILKMVCVERNKRKSQSARSGRKILGMEIKKQMSCRKIGINHKHDGMEFKKQMNDRRIEIGD